MTMARYGRSIRTALTAAAMLALSGCYETQIPIVTQQNAHASPLIPDGRYCEMTFENTRPVTGIGQCITLTWEDGANGWRTDNPLLPGDEHGVSIRAPSLPAKPTTARESSPRLTRSTAAHWPRAQGH